MSTGSPETVPVLIVGGGGAGLTASMPLATQDPDVRPDRFVAWRQATASENPRAVLTEALRKVLAQPVGVELASVA
jgi:hypothetical protein